MDLDIRQTPRTGTHPSEMPSFYSIAAVAAIELLSSAQGPRCPTATQASLRRSPYYWSGRRGSLSSTRIRSIHTTSYQVRR